MTDDRQRPRHPSGRPIRRGKYVELSRLRVPYDRLLTPGLNRPVNVQAIGFRVTPPDDEDE